MAITTLQSHLTGIEIFGNQLMINEVVALQSHLTGIEIAQYLITVPVKDNLQSHLTGIEISLTMKKFLFLALPSIAPYWN